MFMLDKYQLLAASSEVAVAVLLNEDASDTEFLPIRPRSLPDSEIQALAEQWAGRSLRFAGVLGTVNTVPHAQLELHLSESAIVRIAAAFTAYLRELRRDATESGDAVAWCEQLHMLQDPRMN